MRASLVGIAGAAVLGTTLLAGSSFAGDNNTIYIKQESPAGSLAGNTLSVDQSQANGSLVIGPSPKALSSVFGLSLDTVLEGQTQPALQRGDSNFADVKISGTAQGDGGVLVLLQDSSPGATVGFLSPGADGNTAKATIAGNSLGAVIQVGTDNEAQLELNNARGLIGQFGTDLKATLVVSPASNGRILQTGSDNEAKMNVAASGVDATYTQIGRGLTPVNGGEGVVISTTNPGNVTITQIGW